MALLLEKLCGAALAMVAIVMFSTPSAAKDLSAAKVNYTTYCAQCHGVEGKGNGPSAATLNPKPRDFSDCRLMATIPDSTLMLAITEGGAAANVSSKMPAWGQVLDSDQIADLVAYVRSFCKDR